MKKIEVPQTISDLNADLLRKNVSKRSIHVDGLDRTFTYYVPEKLKVNPSIIFLAHGSYCNGDIMRLSTGYAFEERANIENTIIVYPDSFGPYWNDGRRGRPHIAKELNIDERKFFLRMIHYFKGVYGASTTDIFLGGFSNGGAIAFKLMQEKIFKRIAFWCINLPVIENRSYLIEERVPFILINNLEDKMVPYSGGDLFGADGKSRAKFESTYNTFLNLADEKNLPIPNEKSGYSEYIIGENKLLEIYKGGHVIPYNKTTWPKKLGEGSDIDSVSLIFDFFKGL